MTSTSVTDIMECGDRVTIEQVLIFVDAPLVVLLVLAIVFTTLTSMKSKKASSVPGVCSMFLKMSPPAILRNRRRLRDHVILVRVTDTNGKSCNWVEFNPLCGTTYMDLPLPTRQSRLSLVEMRITCPDTYHRPSPQYSEWSKSATYKLRRMKPLSIQSRHLDYQMDTKAGATFTTPLEGVKVVYHLTPLPIKSSAQDIIERGCLVWLSLCLAGLLSFGITQYINLTYSVFATAVVMNALDILITTANVIVAVISGVLAFLFVRILATPFRRYNRRQRRGKYRRLSGHILGHDLSYMKSPVMSSPSIQSLESDVSIPEAKLQASGALDATKKIVDLQSILLSLDIPKAPDDQTQAVELFDNKVNFAPPFKSKSLPCLDYLTLKSANPSPSRHSLPASASSVALQYCPASFSISYEKEDNSPLINKPSKVTDESSLTNKSLEVTEESSLNKKPVKVTEDSSQTNKTLEVTEESSLNKKPVKVTEDSSQTNKTLEVTEESSLTNKPVKVTEDTPLTHKPVKVTVELSLTHKPEKVIEESSFTSKITNVPEESSQLKVTEESLTLTNKYAKAIEQNAEEVFSISLLKSSESSTSVSSTFTIESLPEELPGGVYRTKKYIYTECSTPWYYNSWLDDRPFNSNVYADWLDNKTHNSYNNINNNNNNNSNASTVSIDIKEGTGIAEVSPPRIKITKRYAPFLLVMFAMLGAVIALHIYVVKASLCQQISEASAISWAIASLVLMLIWFVKEIYDFCQSFLNN